MNPAPSVAGSRDERIRRAGLYRVIFPPAARRSLVIALIGSIIVSGIEMASVLLLVPLMELISGQAQTPTLTTVRSWLGNPSDNALVYWLAGLVLGGFLLKDVFTIVYRWWMFSFVNRQHVATSTHIFEYFLHAPFELHQRRSVGDLLRSVGDAVTQFYGRTVAGYLSIISELVTLVAILGALLVVRPMETLLLAVYFGVVGVVLSRAIRPRAERAGQAQFAGGLAAYEALINGLGGIAETKIRHSQPFFLERFHRAATRNAEANRAQSMFGELPKYVFEIFLVLALALVIVVAQASGSVSAVFPTLALFAAGAFRVLPSLTRLTSSVAMVRAGEPARKALLDELASEAEGLDRRRPPRAGRVAFEASLEVRDLWFRYPGGERDVLRGVDLTVTPGSSVALVGGSGAGKTTLANILLGLQEPTAGQVLVDGNDIANDLDLWQNGLAFVPQDVFHMNASLAQNIAFDADPDGIDPERLDLAVARAQLTDLVNDLPRGLDTEIGDRGTRLSGGQRQRVGIARALYRDPQVLILDEATSALDNETERRITETVHALKGQVTLIVIAHRLSTVRDSDEIFFLEEGRVAARGAFADLLHESSSFARLVQLGSLSAESPQSNDPKPV
ncbi:MAG: ABC transporter ATP-binding protein/permease [Actinobacteria bacterium]|jgi:ABC-type bacteriocin/lantibiotic exporters, contain an N-terminal double-glycine peptidase domain|nr:ABC transporter ATP-binding protein/permease [Actinomycetota bacterium]